MMLAIVAALAVAAPGAGQPKPFFLFRIYDDFHKETLWRSDGTASGTRPLGRFCRIAPGPLGKSYFVASDCRTETRLWKSDGTPRGTVSLKTILRGELRAWDFGESSEGIVLYAATATGPQGLWTTDGSARGTTHIAPPGLKPDNGICGLTPWKRENWFWMFDNSLGQPSMRLWKSDGTTAGTVEVAAFPPAFDVECDTVPFKNHMYFTVKHDGLYSQLWRTDGTLPGTTLVRDFGEAIVQGLTVAGDTLFFRTLDRGGDGWWRTDGVPGHEKLVKRTPWRWNQDQNVSTAAWGGVLYFSAFGRQLWKTDGTEAGTTLVKDFGRSGSDDYGDVELLGEHGGSMYLLLGAPTGLLAKGLWKTDGTEKGTVFIKKVGERINWGKKKRK